MKPKKTKKFLQRPEYPGGTRAVREFIASHLQYPEDALSQQLEGIVSVAYQVTDEGVVESAKIIKGLSPSCNEEALRIVKLLKYSKVYNHGVRLKSNHKINIHFHITPTQKKTINISYSVTQTKNSTQKPKSQSGTSYTIVIQKDK